MERLKKCIYVRLRSDEDTNHIIPIMRMVLTIKRHHHRFHRPNYKTHLNHFLITSVEDILFAKDARFCKHALTKYQ